MKDYIDILITQITSIINLSLTEDSLPSHFKSAHVSPPFLKKLTLNKDSMKNYRPVSNLSFLSKVPQKVVVNQLNSHVNSLNTSNQYQSAYRKFQSTETALPKLHNDILASMATGQVTALALHRFLEFAVEHWFGCRATGPGFTGDIGAIEVWLIDWLISAAFDTIDYTILFRWLDDWCGVTGKALNWFKSYLTGRCQTIKIGDCLSSKADLKFGVPQGSVLGPLLFTLYTTPLSSVISGYVIPHHPYADDSQLYLSFASGDSAAALEGLQ